MKVPGLRALLRARAARAAARSIEERLGDLVPLLDARLRRPAIADVAARVAADLGTGTPRDLALAGALVRAIHALVREVLACEAQIADTALRYQAATTPEARRAVLASFVRATVPGRLRARGDIAAAARWFDLEAVQERSSARIADRVDRLEVAYRAIGRLADGLSPSDAEALASKGRFVETALGSAAPTVHRAVRLAALRALARVLTAVSPDAREDLLGAETLALVSAWARGTDAARWLQVTAIEIAAEVLPAGLPSLASELLLRRDEKDGMIIRRNVVRIVTAAKPPGALAVLRIARDDPSEHVRQELARSLAALGALEDLTSLVLGDASPRVRGVGLRALAERAVSDADACAEARRVLVVLLAGRSPPLVWRCSLEAVRRLSTGSGAPLPPDTFVEATAALAAAEGADPQIVDDAMATLRLLEAQARPAIQSVRSTIEAALARLGEGERSRITLAEGATRRDVERALAVAARGDMTVSLHHAGGARWVLTRGEPRRWRLWRFWQELKTPMPDKRKGYVHTRARVWTGEIVAPPIGMAEVTPTRVPGERQLCPPVGGWGAFLPRVDDLLAVCSLVPRTLALVTAAGTILVRGPDTAARRLRVRLAISIAYPRWAEARQRSLGAVEPAQKRVYTEMAQAAGFRFEMADTGGKVGDRAFDVEPLLALRYLGVLPPAILPWVREAVSYVVSRTGNSPTNLAWLIVAVFAFLVVRSAWTMRDIERMRARIPLSIGGWGTRGKSGSERIKAALFHALRYDVVVKTTGCEAMFIHAMRDLPSQEIFIYRPYDKATIWEQRNVLGYGVNLRAQVFLWECMALQPLFVETLQNEWMKDPVTTLTNAYPDHEDIQGPAGEDVARVISKFMPPGGVTFTTEEQMLPLLQDSARRKGTHLVPIAPIEADLLPVDLLDRLPYQEHPRNVALVLALGEHYGVDRELALIEIADHVIMDLGVLKTYGPIDVRGRPTTFSNGMSANERAGFLSNWLRLAFDKHDVDQTPFEATLAIVNNRGDRVARSRVFAQIMVDDAPCNAIVLINSNLGGMLQFITEALDARLAETTLAGEGGPARVLERFDAQMRRLGVRSSPSALREAVRFMLGALGIGDAAVDSVLAASAVESALEAGTEDIGAALQQALASHDPPEDKDDLRPDVVRHAARIAKQQKIRVHARKAVEEALARSSQPDADAAFRVAYRELFLDRIAILWNTDATGDQVVDFMIREIPPGYRVRVMGCQNIKGTGLDFVYRWLQIDRAALAMERARTTPSARGEVLAWVLSHPDWGLYDIRATLASLVAFREDRGEWAAHAAMLDKAIARMTALEADKRAALKSTGKAGVAAQVLGRLERFVDHLDSVRRTYAARRILNDLYAGRLGHGRAAILMRDVVGRGKGGWLMKDIRKWNDRRLAKRAAVKKPEGGG